MKINYQEYSLEELLDVRENIDKRAYPERYQTVLAEIAKRERLPQKEDTGLSLLEEESDGWDSDGQVVLLLTLAHVLPSYVVTDVRKLPAYTTEVHAVQCAEFK